MRLIRWVLGKILLGLNAIFTPSPKVRSEIEQAKVDQETAKLELYQFVACPFCIKVRRAVHRLGLKIELKDAQTDEKARKELSEEGGQIQVPCLRIEKKQWLYESDDIIKYLESRFS
jgi:glutaredoxin